MRNILIFYQEVNSDGAFGIRTFLHLFRDIFQGVDNRVYIVQQQHSDISEFSITEHRDYAHIRFPVPDYKNEGNKTHILEVLSLYVKNIEDSIVFLNDLTQSKLVKEFKEKEPNVLFIRIIHSFFWNWFTNGNESLFKRYVKDKSIDSEAAKYVRHTFAKQKENLDYFDKVISLSPDSGAILSSVYGTEGSKISMIPNGIKERYMTMSFEQKSRLKEDLRIGEGEKILLYTGRFDKLKGLDTLLSAFNKVASQRQDCRLVIIGDGEFKVVSKSIGGAAARITFTGRIAPGEVMNWYRIADIGILPTYSEECSFVGIEMMMHGLPIISTNGRGVRNMFHNMQNSLTVNCRRGKALFERELYDAIIRILDSEDLSNELRQKARKWYLDHYHFDIMKQRYLSLVNELTTEKR